MSRVSDNIEKQIETLSSILESEWKTEYDSIDPSQLLLAQQIVACLSQAIFNTMLELNEKGEL